MMVIIFAQTIFVEPLVAVATDQLECFLSKARKESESQLGAQLDLLQNVKLIVQNTICHGYHVDFLTMDRMRLSTP